MDLLLQLISSVISNQQQAKWLVIGLILLLVFILVLAILLFLNSLFDPARARFLNDSNEEYVAVSGADNYTHKLQAYSHVLLPSNPEVIIRTVQRLHYAGYHAKKYLLQYFAIRTLLALSLPLLTIILFATIPAATMGWLLYGLIFATAIGYILPSFVLDRIIAKRQKIIQNSFPDAIDLLTICSESGLSLDAAIQRVTVELRFSQPILAEEFSIVVSEIQAGGERKSAMLGLAERTGVKDVRGLMSTLSQSMMLGTSVKEALHVYSEDLRDRRMQAAEAMAAKIGAKIIFPLAFCLMPAFLLIVMAPVFLSLSKVMAQ